MEHLKFLFQLYIRPAGTISDIIDHGTWFGSLALMSLVAVGFYFSVNSRLNEAYRIPVFEDFYTYEDVLDGDELIAQARYEKAAEEHRSAHRTRTEIPLVGDRLLKFASFEPSRFYLPIISLSVFYVPFVIIFSVIFGHLGRVGTVFQRDYGTLSTCAMMSWAAAHLPFAVLGIALSSLRVWPDVYFGFWVASTALFAVFMLFAVRTVFGIGYTAAILAVILAAPAFTLGMYVAKYLSPWVLSPFILFYALMYFGGAARSEVLGFGNAFRQRQNFKRYLHNATLNPRDAEAHVQLALIYLQRRQEAKAVDHLTKAIEIDPTEIDANFELGKFKREHGDLSGAIEHFSVVAEQNDKYALSEIWREIGATYLKAAMFEEARRALEIYVERRAFDAEGLYHLGKVYQALGEDSRARDAFEQAVEAAETAPSHRRYELKHWSKLARKEL